MNQLSLGTFYVLYFFHIIHKAINITIRVQNFCNFLREKPIIIGFDFLTYHQLSQPPMDLPIEVRTIPMKLFSIGADNNCWYTNPVK
jgi:hypothetical protein